MVCEFVKVGTVWLPGVAGIRTEYTPVADAYRTLDGSLRVDTLAGATVKRAWRVDLRGLTGAERQAVITLVNGDVTPRSIEIDEVGVITGVIRIAGDTREESPDGYTGGRLEVRIEEV